MACKKYCWQTKKNVNVQYSADFICYNNKTFANDDNSNPTEFITNETTS